MSSVKNVTIEMYVDRLNRTIHCLYSAPSYGESLEIPRGYKQRLVLNDGLHRVKIGVFNATLPLEAVKMLARTVITSKVQTWAF